jgi:hypothetical protein
MLVVLMAKAQELNVSWSYREKHVVREAYRMALRIDAKLIEEQALANCPRYGCMK